MDLLLTIFIINIILICLIFILRYFILKNKSKQNRLWYILLLTLYALLVPRKYWDF